MKFVASCLAFAIGTNAMRSTNIDCRNPEESPAILRKSCSSIWYKQCSDYTLFAGKTCNFETQGDSMIKWFSQDIEAQYWPYINRMNAFKRFPNGRVEPYDEERDSVDSTDYEVFQEESCEPESEAPSVYNSE